MGCGAHSSVLLSSVVEDWALEFHGSSSDMRVQPTRLCATRLTPAGAERLSEEATKVDSMAQKLGDPSSKNTKKNNSVCSFFLSSVCFALAISGP